MIGELKILDVNKKIIARISPSDYFDFLYHTYLSTGAETFDFSVQSNDEYSSVLVQRNYVLFERNEKLRMLQITDCKDEEEGDNIIRKVESEIVGLELINDYVNEFKIEGNMTSILTTVLQDTNYKVGYISPKLDSMITLVELNETTSVYSILQDLIPKFNNAELEFEIKCIDSITGQYEFYVNFYADGERGNRSYKRFDGDFNTYGITRDGDATELCSGLIGVGANGITFKDISWEEGENDVPLNKPMGQDFLVDPEAHAMLGGGKKYILRKYKSEATTPIDLLWDTYYKLQELKQIKYNYEIPITLTDEEFQLIETGDSCYITNDKFNPPIQLEARINELELSDSGNKAKFSNYKELRSKIKKDWTKEDMIKDAIEDLDKEGILTQKDIDYILEQIKQLGLQSEELERAIREHNEYLENKNSDDDLRVNVIDGGLWIGDKRIYDIKKHKLDGINIGNTPPKEPGNEYTTMYVVTSNNLNIRKQPSTSSEILGTFNNGDKINVYSITDGWAKISYNNGIAYVSAKYITEYSAPYDPIKPGEGSKDYAEAVKYYAKFNLGTYANSSSLAKIMSPSNKYKIPTLVKYWSRRFGLDPSLVYCIIMGESSGSPYCATKTSAGGYGIMQCERLSYFNKKQTIKFLDGTTQSFTPSYSTMQPGKGGTTTIDGVVVDKNISNQIMFGCHEFRKSLERFQYNVFASLVGYNFGLYGCDLCICKYVAEKNGLTWVNKPSYTVQSKKVQELYFKELAKLTFAWANERKWYRQVKKKGTPNNVEMYLRWYKSIDGQLPYTLTKDGVKMGYGAYKPTNSNISSNTSFSVPVSSSTISTMATTDFKVLATTTTTKYVNASSLNVRSGPGTSYSILGGLSDGAKVEVISESNGWAKIVYSDGEAYVSSKYLVTYSNGGTDYTGKVATEVRKKITDMARRIVSDHVDKKIATYNQDPRTTRYEKPRIWSGTHYGIKNPVAYDCSSFVGCCYHNAGIDDLIGLSCLGGSLVDMATRRSGYKMWKVTNSSLSQALPGDIVMDANFKITSSNLTRSNMIKEGKTHHTMIYLGNGKVAHASQWAYHPKAIKISNISYYVNKGSAFFLRPYQLAKIDEQSTPVTPTPPTDPGDGTPPAPTDPYKPIVTDPKLITAKGLEGANPRDYYSDTKLKEVVTINGVTDNIPYPSEPPYVFCHFGIKSLGTDDTLYYKSLISSIKARYPRTPIFIAKEYHVPSTYPNYAEINANIDTFNSEMMDYATRTKYVVTLDVPKELITNGYLKPDLTSDGYSCKDKNSTNKYFIEYKKAILNYNSQSSTPIDEPVEKGKPVINGANDVVIRINTTFNPREGVSAYDADDGDITHRIQIEGTVDTTREGEYILTYYVTDNNSNTTVVVRKITVLGNYKPVINGITDKDIKVGDSFDPKEGITATDYEDGNITDRILIVGKVDTNKEGKYKLTYSVTDSYGNTTIMDRYITVNPGSTEEPPIDDNPEPPSQEDPKEPEKPENKVTKSIIMEGQKYYTYGVVHDMTMKLPSKVVQTFFSKLTFTTPKSSPKFTQSKIVYMTGDHCKNGALIVQPNHQYQIIVYTNPDTSQSKYASSVSAYKIGDVEEKFKDFRGAKDIPIIAQSWIDNKSKFTYAHDTVTSYTNPAANKSKWKTSAGKYKVDCSTLAGLIMRGHTYSSSPYAKKTTKLTTNSKYSWAFEMPRNAAEQARYCVTHGWVLNGIDMTDFSNVPVGALIFYDRDSKVINRFMATSHVAVCVGKRNGVNTLIESTTDSNGGIRYKAIKDNTPDKILFIALPQKF